MFEIDKAKFGAFVAQLRKEKGLMQKELAEKLYVSDKAVSKWERGLSIPDVAILVPLAEILGVTVTELLECRRLPKNEPMDSQQTEEIVKKVIGLSEEEQRKYRPDRLKKGLQLFLCAAVGLLEIWVLTMLGYSMEEIFASLGTMMILMAIFGLYFCVFTKEKLPRYYDDNRISSFSDGFLRMNMPGVYFNNRNWPYIVRAGQLWAMIGLVASPACFFVMTKFFPAVWDTAAVYIILILVLGGLFIPMTVVARKYEYAPDNPRSAHVNRKDWIWICGCVIAVVIFVVILRSGVAPTGSGLQMGWVESNTRDHWSATYAFHDGYQQRTINTDGEPTVLEVEIVSSSGEIGMTVTDENGNVIYDQQGIETTSFEIEISGKVVIKITGQDHKGSFSLSW
ncbi:MAG: helix-turn-helix transcriptional regulator [Oscillospiraceae bacterium]|nr:helix-turn-helix transcriptional regulator [Oscillospiraceae bacterium]